MKLLLCADVQLGAACTEKLGIKQSHKWQEARAEKLTDLVDIAARNHASYIALYGRMFGQERISESVIDDLFDAVRENRHIHVLVFLSADEYNRIAYRKDIPENLHLICTQIKDSYVDEDIALRINKGATELQLSDNTPVIISRSGNAFTVSGFKSEQIIPSFEPVGFEDAQDSTFGYAILDWEQEALGHFEVKEYQKYTYRTIELKILPEYGQKEILRKINSAVSGIDADTVLRVIITGKSAFGLTLSGDALKNQLQKRFFHIEVYDNTVMDVDESSFENDISLRSEFVRLALQDDSLSETERNRIISCGWNALNGKEVSAD